MTRFILCVSLLVNGALAGLILGHLHTATADGCSCRRCQCREEGGPYPTGWVVPDEAPKPKGATP